MIHQEQNKNQPGSQTKQSEPTRIKCPYLVTCLQPVKHCHHPCNTAELYYPDNAHSRVARRLANLKFKHDCT